MGGEGGEEGLDTKQRNKKRERETMREQKQFMFLFTQDPLGEAGGLRYQRLTRKDTKTEKRLHLFFPLRLNARLQILL